MQTSDYRLYVSFPPHVLGKKTVSGIIYNNLIALIPAVIAGLYYFRMAALEVMVLSVLTALICEVGMQIFLKRDITVTDGHAIMTGLLLAFLLPPSVPWWLVVVGSGTAIILGKMIFGELGNNPFNPTLVGLVMVRLSWSDRVQDWVEQTEGMIPDPPLWIFKFDGLDAFVDFEFRLFDLFIGRQAGGIGSICIIALLAGGIYLLSRRMIAWQIPAGLLGAVFIFSGILWLIDQKADLNPFFHLVAGRAVLGAFFLAADPVTSPVTRWGKLVYGVICGVLIMVIRTWGKYPDGVVFAILLANTCSPLLNKIRPRPYGKEKDIA